MFTQIQQFVWKDDPANCELYGKFLPARIQAATLGNRSLIVVMGQRFSSDSYFNALFEMHWLRHAAVAGWKLSLLLDGEATVRVVRSSPRGTTTVAEIARVGAGGQADMLIRPDATAPDSRLWFEIEAHSDITLAAATWSGDVDAVRPVSLLACYCTFNREDYLINNVQTLLANDVLWASLKRIIIVNQGTKDLLSRSLDQLESVAADRVQLIEQDNYGGSGGFARAMLESLADGTATHLILMDDDIAIDAETVCRTAAFLKICRCDTALGGQMLDLNAPALMHEAAAVFSPDKLRVRALHRDADVRREGTLTALSQELKADYNAWFYFAASLENVRRVGLPWPFFINYDDVEYGFRLREHGVALAVVPGIAVWHRPGYLTDNKWKTYYYIRNLLIINALYEVAPNRAIAGMIVKRCCSWLSKGDLAHVRLTCMAILDYLKGKDGLTREPGRRHAEVRRLCFEGCESLSRVGLALDVVSAILRMQMVQARTAEYWRSLRATLTSPEWWRDYLGVAAPFARPTKVRPGPAA